MSWNMRLDIGSGQTKKVNLNLAAAQIGRFRNTILVSGQGGLHDEHQIDMEVIAPQLTLASEGPQPPFSEAQCHARLFDSQHGNRDCNQLDLVAKLPRGVKFISANKPRSVRPGFECVLLESRPTERISSRQRPVDDGSGRGGRAEHRVHRHRDLDQKATFRQPLLVEGSVELFFEIDDVDDVIEIGSETRYRVR